MSILKLCFFVQKIITLSSCNNNNNDSNNNYLSQILIKIPVGYRKFFSINFSANKNSFNNGSINNNNNKSVNIYYKILQI